MQSHGLVLEYEEDELSVAQQNQYALALKAYEKAMTEVELLKKGDISKTNSYILGIIKLKTSMNFIYRKFICV